PLRKLLDSRVVAGIVGEPLDERGVSGGFLATSGLPLFVNESVYCLVLLLRFVYTFRTFAASKISYAGVYPERREFIPDAVQTDRFDHLRPTIWIISRVRLGSHRGGRTQFSFTTQSNCNLRTAVGDVIVPLIPTWFSAIFGGKCCPRRLNLTPIFTKKTTPGKKESVSAQAIARRKEVPRINIPKDNWLGFVGDVQKFTGEVTFRTSLRIDGNFSGQVNSESGTLTVSDGAKLTEAVINVAVAKINGTVEGEVHASELVLGRNAKVTGDLSARTLIIEEGALFNGRCHTA